MKTTLSNQIENLKQDIKKVEGGRKDYSTHEEYQDLLNHLKRKLKSLEEQLKIAEEEAAREIPTHSFGV